MEHIDLSMIIPPPQLPQSKTTIASFVLPELPPIEEMSKNLSDEMLPSEVPSELPKIPTLAPSEAPISATPAAVEEAAGLILESKSVEGEAAEGGAEGSAEQSAEGGAERGEGVNIMILDCEWNSSYMLKRNFLVEVYWMVVELGSWKILREGGGLVKPFYENRALVKRCIECHGITYDKAMREGGKLSVVMSDLLTAIRNLKVSYILAHNFDGDRQILFDSAGICGMRFPVDVHWKCSMKHIVDLGFPKGERSLGAVYQKLFGVPISGAHRAKNDVMALFDIWKKLNGGEKV